MLLSLVAEAVEIQKIIHGMQVAVVPVVTKLVLHQYQQDHQMQ
tara:strand:+ start:1039 stop:1167 length:129 start_codon:yes stop_codon:yes gene_type:complete